MRVAPGRPDLVELREVGVDDRAQGSGWLIAVTHTLNGATDRPVPGQPGQRVNG